MFNVEKAIIGGPGSKGLRKGASALGSELIILPNCTGIIDLDHTCFSVIYAGSSRSAVPSRHLGIERLIAT